MLCFSSAPIRESNIIRIGGTVLLIYRMLRPSDTKLDFSSSSALKAVNDWSSKHTNGMIPKLMDQLKEDAALMLMNAISFKATWTDKFDEKDTQIETFTKEDGTTQSVKMMHRHAIARVGEESDFYTLLLPYRALCSVLFNRLIFSIFQLFHV